jgi:long-chain acyl-CoA synthetase
MSGRDDVSRLPATIAMLPFFASGRHPRPDLLGRCGPDGITWWSGRELAERVRDLGLGLAALGLAAGDRVALVSESRPEWLLADFAILSGGAVTVPVYPTLSADQVAFLLRDCGARFAIVSTGHQLAKVLAAAPESSSLEGVIVIDSQDVERADGPPVWTIAEIAERGHRQILDGWGVGREFQDRAKQVRPADLATIVYTSGTTGVPKGVMLTHGNLVANLDGVLQVFAIGPEDVALSFLPLSHVFERMVAYVFLTSGVSTVFAESPETVARDLKLVRPTVMTGVPRVFEKLHARVLAGGEQARGIRRTIFNRAVTLAVARGARLTEGQPLTAAMRAESRLAERLVFRKIRDAVGGRLRFAVSGSAPLRPDIGRFFYGVGIPILEGYGLTETAPVLTVTREGDVRFGAVGKPLPNVELRIAPDGEILARGPNVMQGYYGRPDETAEVLRDGWFHTGDIGSFDEQRNLRITDRKKELIITSGGKKVAPQPIEQRLRAHPLIAEAMVVGEQRHFAAALLVPDLDALSRTLGVPRPSSPGEVRRLLDRADVQARFERAIEEVNRGLARFEHIRRFRLLEHPFTVESGELSLTLKVRRRVIEERYREEIEAMYS